MPPSGPGAPRRGKRAGGLTGSLRRAFVGAALLTTVPFLALIGYLAWGQVSRERDRVARDALAQATLASAQVDKHIGARLEAVSSASTLLGSGPGLGSADAQARRLKQGFADLDRVLVVDEIGVALASVPPVPEGRRVAVGDQEWFKRAATSTEPFLGTPWRSGADVLVGLYGPVRTPEGQLRGVIAADLSLRRVQELLAAPGLGPGAVAVLLTDRGVIVARAPALYLMQSISNLGPYADLLSRGGGRDEIVFEDGTTRLAGAVRVRPAPWVLVVGMPSAQVLRETRDHLLQVGGAALVLALVSLVAAVRMSARQASGFTRLRQAMARLEAGDPPASVPVTVGGEAGALTERFNAILSWIHAKLREHEAVSQVQEAADQIVGGDRSLDAILPGLLRRVVSGIGADAGVLVLQDESGFVARASVGLPGVQVEGVRSRRGQGLAAAAASERAPVVIPDVEADYRVEEPYLKTSGVRSVTALPLFTGEELLGVVVVGYRTSHGFASDEVQRLEAIVRRTAQAIERARALDAFQRSAQGLEARLAAQGEALEKSAAEQAEARRQAQEARTRAQELEQRIKLQAAEAPRVKEVIVEREVVRADPGAEEAARVRAEIQRTVSEELRAPLTALLELPRFLVVGLQKPLGDAERAQLDILQERSQEIVELIEGLAVWTALQGGATKTGKAPVDLAILVQRVVRALQPRASARGNRIEVDIKPGTGQVVTDARRLEQILHNLLLSAIKFTEVGEIRVTCYQSGGETVITVADDGTGFTPEEQARIFQPFLSLAPRDGRSLPGTGLLLAVAERLVTALGGKIRVESELDRGTWVTVMLPAQS